MLSATKLTPTLPTATETVSLSPGAMDSIMQASGGDMRKAVTYLQTAHQLSDGIPVTSEDIVDISGQVGII